MSTNRGEVQVQFLKDVLANNGRIAKGNFSLQRGLLENLAPTYYLTLEQSGVRSLQEFSWTPELESYLLFDLGLKMTSVDDDVERFAQILLNNLANAEALFGGPNYVRAVLVEILREKPQYRLDDLIQRIAVAKPARGKHWAACREFLLHSIEGLQNSVYFNLDYKDEAVTLMSRALEIVLDETFHISTSEMLFPSE